MSENIEVLLRAKETAERFGPVITSHKSLEVPCILERTDQIGSTEEVELVQRVFLLPPHEAPRVVVFCGVGQTDGAGGICVRAGQNLVNQTGSSVCVVEGNFRSPSLHQCLGMENSRGLSEALFESKPIQDFVQFLPKSNLSALPVGSCSMESQAMWQSERLRSRIVELRRVFSYVLVYGPPVSQHVGGMLLGQFADGVILILESMVTRREKARTAKETLAAANVKILGAVLNNHTFPIPENLYRRL